MTWHTPLPYRLIPTEDSDSFTSFGRYETGLPITPHVGAFGTVRKYHQHEGVDLYAPQGCPVFAVEDGEVVAIIPFTGKFAGSDWWMDTYAIFVEGKSGVAVYGEVASHTKLNAKISTGELLGVVSRVLKVDKGRPLSMLHFELHTHGSRSAPVWNVGEPKPEILCDPTQQLLAIRS